MIKKTETITGSREYVFKRLFSKEVIWLKVIWFIYGILFMAALDIGDIHVCVGECDGAGYDIADIKR